ncbi:hypothetical protein ACVA51_13590 [Pseudomonas luteola]
MKFYRGFWYCVGSYAVGLGTTVDTSYAQWKKNADYIAAIQKGKGKEVKHELAVA